MYIAHFEGQVKRLWLADEEPYGFLNRLEGVLLEAKRAGAGAFGDDGAREIPYLRR